MDWMWRPTVGKRRKARIWMEMNGEMYGYGVEGRWCPMRDRFEFSSVIGNRQRVGKLMNRISVKIQPANVTSFLLFCEWVRRTRSDASVIILTFSKSEFVSPWSSLISLVQIQVCCLVKIDSRLSKRKFTLTTWCFCTVPGSYGSVLWSSFYIPLHRTLSL